MNKLNGIRTIVNYTAIFFPLLVILIGFFIPRYNYARFYLFPVWYYLYGLISFFIQFVSWPIIIGILPGFAIIRDITPGFETYILEIIPLFTQIFALVITVAVTEYYKVYHAQGEVSRIDNYIIFISITIFTLIANFFNIFIFNRSLLYGYNIFYTIYYIFFPILPIIFTFLTWKKIGHIAPFVTHNIGKIIFIPRIILSLLIVISTIFIFVSLMFLNIKNISGGMVGFSFMVPYVLIINSLLFWVGLGFYEGIRYVQSRQVAT